MPCKKSKVWIIEKDWKTFTATRYKDEPYHESTINKQRHEVRQFKAMDWGP